MTATIDRGRLAEITHLDAGGHDGWHDGVCVMERRCMACHGSVEPEMVPCADCNVLFCSGCFLDHAVPEGCGDFGPIARWLLGTTCEFRADGKPSKGQPTLNRLYGRIGINPLTGCWEFQGGRDDDGYGVLVYEGKSVKAHRLGWQLLIGQLSDEEKVCHRCDNPACLCPTHWFVGTIGDNNRDRAAKGRTQNGAETRAYPQGDRHWSAKLSAQQIEEIRARRAGGETTVALGLAFGVNPATISRITRRVWRREVA